MRDNLNERVDLKFSSKQDEFEVLVRHPGRSVHLTPDDAELRLIKERLERCESPQLKGEGIEWGRAGYQTERERRE